VTKAWTVGLNDPMPSNFFEISSVHTQVTFIVLVCRAVLAARLFVLASGR
jgi:hypothetical protein